MVSAEFEKIFNEIKTPGYFGSNPSNDELLDLYAYNKIARGDDIKKAEKPGMFDLSGKARRKRWEERLADGLTPEQAEQKYIELAAQLREKYPPK